MDNAREIHIHIHEADRCSETGEVLRLLRLIVEKEERIMATLAELQAAVAAEDTVIDSAVALINGLADQIAALQPDQAAIDALAVEVRGKTADLSAAVTARTPAA